ncbi:hypothetical protein Bca52824_026144 [Brassica carinata]|uniref:Uncharacterized protein n=1 Tax=Brassica carinata TaxID=52824 RepID=A0A8X7VA68_BRACI|nr:hypothetical protein Bca52824_026144 [Brassica carinata]
MFNERTKSSDFLQAMSSDFGLSCCEIQYGSCLDDKNKLVKIQSKKKAKKNTKREAESCTLDPSCYVANVMPSSLRYDMLDKIGDWKQLTEAELDKNLIQKAMSSDFGLSCCEIQYGSCLDDKNKLVKIQSKKKAKKNTKREAESCTLDPSCYVANVMPSSLRYDMLVSTPNFFNQKLSFKVSDFDQTHLYCNEFPVYSKEFCKG